MILALDLATRTGWCAGIGDDLPTVGHVDLPKTGDDVGRYLLAAEAWIIRALDKWRPTDVVFEAPILGRFATALVTRKLHALPGVVEMACIRHPCRPQLGEVAPASAKKVLAGFGRAGKDEMIEAARAFGLTITCSDEADAFAVWVATVLRRYPQHAHRWSRIEAHARNLRP